MLRIENLTKTFDPGTVNEKRIIDHLNLQISAGDFIVDFPAPLPPITVIKSSN